MKNKKIDYNFFHWGPFLYKTTLNKEEIKEIRNLCSKNNKDVRDTLAGLINHEYEVDVKNFSNNFSLYTKLCASLHRTL